MANEEPVEGGGEGGFFVAAFASRKLPPCSIIRPTETRGIAKGVVKFLTDMGLFIGQSPEFFAYLNDLAEDADEAK